MSFSSVMLYVERWRERSSLFYYLFILLIFWKICSLFQWLRLVSVGSPQYHSQVQLLYPRQTHRTQHIVYLKLLFIIVKNTNKISKEKRPRGEHQAQPCRESPLPLDSHGMCIISPVTSCDVTCKMRSTRKVH